MSENTPARPDVDRHSMSTWNTESPQPQEPSAEEGASPGHRPEETGQAVDASGSPTERSGHDQPS